MKKTCGDCKYFEQGDKNSFCGNKDQKNTELRKYLYYNFFACDLFEKGIAVSRKEFMNKLKSNESKATENN